MIIKELVLKNIRSYRSATIAFPEGSILLSGDVGAGKSTILLAIEFGLFGAIRGLLGADSMLRKGSPAGCVKLTFTINNKEYIIERNIRKQKERVSQESGYIVANDIKFIGTATELRAKMLEILSYPEDAFKRKSMIFRYTVYTPQEQMKDILTENQEARLDTLRKIFGIHKYKIIRENIIMYAKHLRDKIIHLQGVCAGIDEKQLQLEKKQEHVATLIQQYELLVPVVEEMKKHLDDKQKVLAEQVKKNQHHRQLKHNLEKIFSEKSLLQQQFNQAKQRIADKTAELQKQQSLELKRPEESSELIERKIMEKEQGLQKIFTKVKEKEVLLEKMKGEINKINSLGTCPLCKQHVPHEHKEQTVVDYDVIFKQLEDELHQFTEEKSKHESVLKELKKKHKDLAEIWKQYELKLHQQQLIQKQNMKLQQEIEYNEKQLDEIKKNIGKRNQQEQQIYEELKQTEEIDLRSAEKELELLKVEYETAQKTYAQLEKEKDIEQQAVKELQIEYDKLQAERNKQKQLEKRKTWLTEKVSPSMNTMEKHVFMQVYQEFNALFRDWFFMLVDEQNFNVQLNDEFAPLIIQNGYEIPLHDLSGGEKTAVSLAYRLALNKVINDLISTIRTKELIVLDEPTDGFSADQLNAVREILYQIGLKQIILVSHEQKIESFVDHVIHIEKKDHESYAV